jgi:pyruvate,orthophosphate dikinase
LARLNPACGAMDIIIDYKNQTVKKGNIIIKEGDIITLNGDTGEVIIGLVEMVQPDLSGDFLTIMNWAKEFKRMGVRANSWVSMSVQ